MNPRAVFTINFGGYDSLKEPIVKADGWDYIVFTNNPELKSDFAEVRYVNLNLPNHLAARYVYINSHLFLPEHEETLMIGGQVRIAGDLNKFIAGGNYKPGADINLLLHPCRTCIYKEAEIVVRENIDPSGRPQAQMARYWAEGMPENFGLFAHGIIFRKNLPGVARHNELWWKEVMLGSHRDQLSFMYVLWKYNLVTCHGFPWNIIKSEFFNIYFHGQGDRIA